MLELTVPGVEGWDEEKEQFVSFGGAKLSLEHSLVSLSKWESITEKPFLSGENKTNSDLLKYIECMILTPEFSPEVLLHLTSENVETINQYINARMTATWFTDHEEQRNNETITAEIIYYWMIALNIPTEFQYWHLNKLLALIKVCNIKNTPPKKMSSSQIRRQNAELNAQRKAQMGTKG